MDAPAFHQAQAQAMTVARITEGSARGNKSFEAAIWAGIDRVNDSVGQVIGMWIQDQISYR